MSNIKWSHEIRITMYKLLNARMGAFDINLLKHMSTSEYHAHLSHVANILTKTYDQDFTAEDVRSEMKYLSDKPVILNTPERAANWNTTTTCAVSAGFITPHDLLTILEHTVFDY